MKQILKPMNYIIFIISFLVCLNKSSFSQNYTSYFIGNNIDAQTLPSGGVCLMGGASEVDNAMSWFLQRANGGDILVLRTSGSDGYNNYLYSNLGVNVNSVETIVFNDSTATNEPYIHQKIQQAEAIWFAGGDQWDYISYWRDSEIDSLINYAITNRNIVIGGSSAGMAIQGKFYFSAENGTVSSSTALSNPYDNKITVDSLSFISNQYLNNTITDTHYDNPNRKGRHIVFLARILVDYGVEAKGIACDEYTAVCIDTNGIAKVFGDYPNYDDNAYFIQTNCELMSVTPENCSSNSPLDWNLGNEAIKVYSIKGTINGSNTFDLNDWETGKGGIWEDWYVINGDIYQQIGSQINCSTLNISNINQENSFQIFPNPSSEILSLTFNQTEPPPKSLKISNKLGQIIKHIIITNSNTINISISEFPKGIYLVQIRYTDGRELIKKLIIK